MRFWLSGIGFTLVLVTLSANLAATATPLKSTQIDRAIPRNAIAQQRQSTPPLTNSQTVTGIGVEFLLPSRFKAGSPADKELRALFTADAKQSPITASVMTIFDNSGDMQASAVAIDNSRRENLEILLVTTVSTPSTLSLEDMQANFDRASPNNEFVPVKTGIVTIGSRRLLQIQGNLNIKGSQAKVFMGFLKEGDKTFQLTYVYGTPNTRQALPVFEQIVRTFKVMATSDPATPSK
ncbi:hypothetical protein [Chamaesiphon sp. OTE_20_metabat_361]|uniref:hypothetical protein n=1 Tax=Chamaesiphon sp. OTE_20_metabat_361 TaxID=2964689 RepID=UPI00286B06EE|nr:hypothetical protein [Chamaesiphon sp. OTE_20_metabat_361]